VVRVSSVGAVMQNLRANIPPGDVRPQSASLSDLVMRVADDPSRRNRDAFYVKFATSRVGARVPAELGRSPVGPGRYVTVRPSVVPVEVGKAQDGSAVLVVLADAAQLAKVEPAASFIEIAAADVMTLAASYEAGIVVQASKDGRQAWAAIPKTDVPRLARWGKSATESAD
jgi:hypothetical protein